MRCASYCTAVSYNTQELVKQLVEDGYEPKYFDDVIHVQRDLGQKNRIVDLFYFPFGCVTIWGADESEDKSIIEELVNCEIDHNNDYTYDVIYYRYDDKSERTYIDEEKNEIILNDSSAFVKLSMSHALAQSVKLEVLEKSVAALLDKTTPIQRELAKKGSVSMSKTEISKQIGVLFNERYSINMHSDILDTPEFFWRRPSYEPLYLMTAEFQDIQVRQNILNHRLDMIHELYSILSNELNYKHSTRLEWIIIILIAIEVVMGFQNYNISKFLGIFG
ncbi:MAG: hypothetical protein K0Q51_1502 [Rickettsiaceae bacterium]|jgi:uncharacterized Rmd1/YagE family protein|nr:hypothetical protein [Rickettsiaceae bacterium]